MEYQKRKHPRLSLYDYSQSGVYFITICTKDKKRILCDIVDGTSKPIVCVLKRLINKEIGENIFQTSFYDHIIRDEEDYIIKWKYIEENPIKWLYYDEKEPDEIIT